ncbi:hypothetical protein IQ254_28860 [Nodosilinea sp. LEGE 07088]|uniref:hypothetical protein n=1 Tax=Nodosilinea sp. LEGE 07088 TaxID=2777968 RepID=UPI001880B33D|nr:hypothetical protein [Nodosilinea sp. LEGE 07088]MBE9141166.1 hypothetical protein [Nodosilinea sp. LEGE 07088]
MGKTVEKIRRHPIDRLERQPQGMLMGLSLALACLIGTIDFVVRQDIALSIFYLAPIAIAAWFISYRAGLFISGVCTFIWFQADIVAKHYDFALLPYWNAAVRLGFFSITSYLLATLRKAYQREQLLARLDDNTPDKKLPSILPVSQSLRCPKYLSQCQPKN